MYDMRVIRADKSKSTTIFDVRKTSPSGTQPNTMSC